MIRYLCRTIVTPVGEGILCFTPEEAAAIGEA